ncbi:MAG: hypothetical protein K0S80_4287 [Neobacillus sp.]|nr:hypothetical protein [Neobacillus sp.]
MSFFSEKNNVKVNQLESSVAQNTQQLGQIKKETFKENIIEVGAGKTFSTVTSAINSIKDNAPNKRYCIKVFAGTYPERIILKPYVGVEGENRESVIFEWDRPLTTADADVTSQSMVELHEDGSYIRNITVKGANFRYMIHTEFGSNSDRSVEIINCHIEHKGNDASYTWTNPHALGSGLGASNTKITVKGSRLIGAANGRAILTHDNSAPTAPSYLEVADCILLNNMGSVYRAVNLDNYSVNKGTVPWYVSFNNNFIQVGIDTTTTANAQRCRISGGGNSMQVYYSGDWVDSTAGYIIKNASGATILSGTAVLKSETDRAISGVMNGTSYSNYSRFLGFSVEDIPDGAYGKVCYKGSINALFNGVSNWLDELMLDTNGQVIKYDTATAGRRPVIGQHIQSASASIGTVRQITLRNNIKDVIASNILTRGSNVVSYPWGGTPANAPSFVGQFAIDTVSGGIYFAKGTSTADWIKLSN